MIKKISVVLSFSFLLLFANCTNDEFSGPPRILLTPNFGNADIGGTISTSVDIEAPNGFKSLTITTIVDDVRDDVNAEIRISQVHGQTGLVFPYLFDETTRMMAAASVIDVEFLLLDDDDLTDVALFRVGINAPATRIAPGVSLTPPQSGMGSGSNSTTFFSSSNEQPSWTVAQVNAETEDVSADIDFGYYYDATTNSAVLASIFDYPIVNLDGMENWSTRNRTVFRKTTLTTAEFDDAGFREIYNAFESGTAGDRAERSTDLAVDDIIAFETNTSKGGGSKRGLIRVHEIQAGDGTGDFIQITVIFEE